MRPLGERAPLPGRCVREGQLGVARLVDLDHQRHAALMASHRERLSDVLVRQGIHDLKVGIGTPPLYHAARQPWTPAPGGPSPPA